MEGANSAPMFLTGYEVVLYQQLLVRLQPQSIRAQSLESSPEPDPMLTPLVRAPSTVMPLLASRRCGDAAMQVASPPSVSDVPMTFEAQMDPLQAAFFFAIIALPFGYWWYITVPEARLKLAKDKRLEGGDVKAYIDELRDDPSPRSAERWFFSKYLSQMRPRANRGAREQAALQVTAVEGDAIPPASELQAPPAETAPLRDGAPPRRPSLRELFQPASLSGNATPRFWSGDNPIVVTMGALLCLGVVASAARANASLTADALVLGAGLVFGVTRLTLK